MLVIVVVVMLSGGKLTPLESRTTLVFAHEGRLVEQDSWQSLSRNLARATHVRECQ